MPQPEVTPQGAQPSGAGSDPQGGKGKGSETVTLTRAEFESLNRRLNETQESERYWAGLARQGGGAGGDRNTQEEPEELVDTQDLIPEVTGQDTVDKAIFEDPDKWAEAISKGPAAIEAFVRKAGFVTAREAADIAAKVARRTVDVERGKMTTDAKIFNDFPELGDKDSELFKATAAELKELVAMDPSARNRPSTLYAAAKAAKAKLDAQRPQRRREAEDEDRYDRFDDDDPDDRGGRRDDDPDERDRRRRIDAQDGRTRGRESRDDGDSYLGPQAREVMSALGVDEKDFLEERRKLGGGGRRRR